jgi:hypothetical protein
VAEADVKKFYAAGFDVLIKRWDICRCWWRICREINVFFPRFEYHMLYVLYPLVTYLMTLPRTKLNKGIECYR